MAKNRWSPGDIVIEMAATKGTRPGHDGFGEPYGPTNSNFLVKFFGAILRGRFAVSDIPNASSSNGYANMPVIPGIYVVISPKRKKLLAIDPLGFPENGHILRQANAIREPMEGKRFRAWDDMVIENATATEIKTALMELRGYLDDKSARVIDGDMPSVKEILAMNGEVKVRYNFLKTVDATGEKESPFATQEELERMGAPQEERVKRVPPGTAT